MPKDLVLKRADHPRMPSHDQKNDYDVLRDGRAVGRIWRHEYQDHPWSGKGPWHWSRGVLNGHAPTLESAMADFRRAWNLRHA